MKKYTYIDLFSGCGGLSEGFSKSGLFEGVAHIEWELPMVETLRYRLTQKWNHTEQEAIERVIHFDIQKTNELINGDWNKNTNEKFGPTNAKKLSQSGLKGLVGNKNIDIIIGGPPCQAYSIAGRAQDKNKMEGDYRNFLFESFVKVVEEFKPKLFVFENVPGILTARPGGIPVTDRIYNAFKNIGYTIKKPTELKNTLYSAVHFGVAQNRQRMILIGVKNGEKIDLDSVYNAIDKQKTNEVISLRDVIGNLSPFYPIQESFTKNGRKVSHQGNDYSLSQHYPRYHNLLDIEIFKEWVENDYNQLSQAEKISYYFKKRGKKSNHVKYRNLQWDEPSPTIVAHLNKDGLMFIHPDAQQARSLTVREAAIIQSFPLDYEFKGSMGNCYKMIGNAVPPLMAEKIARGIAQSLESKKHKKMNILVACEESQAVTKELRSLGHNAFSCDLIKCSGGHPEWHFNTDVFKVIAQKGGLLQNGEYQSVTNWDMMIAHPPCTFLASSGAQWYYHPDDKHLPTDERRPHPRFPTRSQDREAAVKFFIDLYNAPIEKIAIENPVGIISSRFMKPSQIVQPWMFGDEATKTTCLWLKNLPHLNPTKKVGKGERLYFPSGKSMQKWYADALANAKNDAERRTLRSKTFKGMAKAMALQWTTEEYK